MKSSYKKLGNYIQIVNKRDTDKKVTRLLGVSIRKVLMPSIANIIGTDMSTYKIIKKNQFAYGPVTSRNGDKISVALLDEYEEAIVSQAYTVFEIIDKNELLPEYLMMWFRRPEFDRYARFKSHGSAREIFGWEEMCDTELPIPSIEKQKEIVKEYHILVDRIDLNNQLITKLEETAQAIYKQWFVDFEFPDENGLPYKSNGGEMEFCEELDKEIPKGWEFDQLGLICEIKSGKSQQDRVDFQDKKYLYPVFGAAQIIGYSSSFLYDEEILITGRVGTHGVIQRVNEKVWPSDNALVLFTKYFEFLYQILKHLKYDEILKGSSNPLITQGDLKAYKIIIPKIETMKYFNETAQKIMFNLDLMNKEIDVIVKLKDLLLSKLATINN